jgi:hypothetical protein
MRTPRDSGGSAAEAENFGVATRLEFRLHPLERVVGGRLEYVGKGVSEALRRFREVVAGAPRDLSCGALLPLDESLEPTLTIAPCYTGSDTDAEELRVLRSAPGLVSDCVGRLAFLGQQHLFNPPYGEDRNYWKSQFVSELPDELIDELLRRMTALARPPGQVLFESLHGAPKEADATIGFRRAAFNISAMASWQDPALDPQFIAWARDTAAALGAVVGQRRVRQLYAGGRTHRACARRLRRRDVRAPPDAEEALRPEQRAAPQSEHSRRDQIEPPIAGPIGLPVWSRSGVTGLRISVRAGGLSEHDAAGTGRGPDAPHPPAVEVWTEAFRERAGIDPLDAATRHIQRCHHSWELVIPRSGCESALARNPRGILGGRGRRRLHDGCGRHIDG